MHEPITAFAALNACIYTATVMQYLTAELLVVAGDETEQAKKKVIQLAVAALAWSLLVLFHPQRSPATQL